MADRLIEGQCGRLEWSDGAFALIGEALDDLFAALGVELEKDQLQMPAGQPPEFRIGLPPEIILEHRGLIESTVIHAFQKRGQNITIQLVRLRLAPHEPGLVVDANTGEPTTKPTQVELNRAQIHLL